MDTYDEAVRAALAAVDLPGLQVVAAADDIAALERTPGCRVTFAAALQFALEAFLSDGRGSMGQGHDAAVDVVHSAPEDFGLGPAPTDAEVAEALRRVLADDSRAKVVLLTPTTVTEPAYRFLPEYGESITDNWVFRIIAPANWPFLQWSIVDLRSELPAYSYEFD